MKMSLSTKLLLSIVILVVCLISIVTYFNSETLKTTILQRERDFNLSLLEVTSKQIESYFEKKVLILKNFTNENINKNFKQEDIANKLNYLNEVVGFKIYSIQLKKIIFDFKKNESSIFSNEKESFDIKTALFMSQNPIKIHIVNSVSFIANKSKNELVSLYIPYSRVSNKLDQVLIADIEPIEISKLLSNMPISHFQIFNEFGSQILSSSQSQILSKKDVRIGSEEFNFIRNHSMSKYSGVVETNKKSVVFSFVKNKFDFYLVSQTPLETLLAPAQIVFLNTVRIAGYFLAITLFLLFVFSQSIVRPIELVSLASQKIAKGIFSTDLLNSSKGFFKDEVSVLTDSILKMIKGLKERDQFKNLFNKFHGSAVTENLLQNEVALRGEKRDVFVFFSDLRGFTHFSEGKDPKQVVEMLNEYFSYMVPAINDSGGVVDKFIGDAIMAVWGAPRSTTQDGKSALMACLNMRKNLEKLNQVRQQRGEPAVWIGMGLHYGEAISGTVGSSDRMEYTVIGNTVNTASRIEASTKAFGTDLLISFEAMKQLENDFIFEAAGAAEVKGRSEPLKLYKVHGYRDMNRQDIIVSTPYSKYEAEGAEKVKVVA